MKCPVHAVEMQDKSGDGISYKECPECGGIWMRHRALRTLAEGDSMVSALSLPREHEISGFMSIDSDDNDVVNCPLDGAKYYERKFASVRIDICPQCDGIWLDPGELEKIKDYLAETTPAETIVEKVSRFLSRFREEDGRDV